MSNIYTAASFFRPQYIEIVETALLNPVQKINSKALLAVACKTTESGTRLIDNVVLGGDLNEE